MFLSRVFDLFFLLLMEILLYLKKKISKLFLVGSFFILSYRVHRNFLLDSFNEISNFKYPEIFFLSMRALIYGYLIPAMG